MWRCKEQLRKTGLLVTEDSTARLKKQLAAQREAEEAKNRKKRMFVSNKNFNKRSPKKVGQKKD